MYFWLGAARSYRKENVRETGASELARNVKLWKSGTQRSCWNKASGSVAMGSLGILLSAFLALSLLSPWADSISRCWRKEMLLLNTCLMKGCQRKPGEGGSTISSMCNWLGQGEGGWARPSVPCVLVKLALETGRQKVLYSSFWKEHIWRSPCGITNILPRKKHLYPTVRLSNLSLALISLKQALGLFPQQLHLLKLSTLFYIQNVIFTSP